MFADKWTIAKFDQDEESSRIDDIDLSMSDQVDALGLGSWLEDRLTIIENFDMQTGHHFPDERLILAPEPVL